VKAVRHAAGFHSLPLNLQHEWLCTQEMSPLLAQHSQYMMVFWCRHRVPLLRSELVQLFDGLIRFLFSELGMRTELISSLQIINVDER